MPPKLGLLLGDERRGDDNASNDQTQPEVLDAGLRGICGGTLSRRHEYERGIQRRSGVTWIDPLRGRGRPKLLPPDRRTPPQKRYLIPPKRHREVPYLAGAGS